MRYTNKQLEIINQLEGLVHYRFNKKTLEKKLSEIFNEPIKLVLGYQDVKDFSDYDYMFTSDKEEIGGDFDIYILKHKHTDINGNTWYVTEVGYEFFN